MTLLGDNIDSINKNADTLFDACKEIGLEINIDKTKYMLLSCHQSAGRSKSLCKSSSLIFVDDNKKMKFYSAGNEKEIEFW
jgi:hypothetical protein